MTVFKIVKLGLGEIALACLLSAPAFAQPCLPDFHGLPIGKFQKCFEHWSSNGRAPVALSAYQVNGSVLIAGSFQKKQPPKRTNYMQTPQQYREKFKALKAKGFRPGRVSALTRANETLPRFTTIWMEANEPFENVPGAAECIDDPCPPPGLSLKAFRKRNSQMREEGYALADIAVYRVGSSGLVFNATWTKRPVDEVAAGVELDEAAFRSKNSELTRKGFVLIRLQAYPHNGIKFAAIWEKRAGTSVFELLLSGSQYQTKYNQHIADGYVIQDISAAGDPTSSDDFITAVWVK